MWSQDFDKFLFPLLLSDVMEFQDNSNTIDQKAASKKVPSSRELVTPGAKKGHARLEPTGVNNTKERTETKINKDLQVKECTDMYANKIHETEEPDQTRPNQASIPKVGSIEGTADAVTHNFMTAEVIKRT